MAGLFDFLRDNPAITQGLLAGGFGAMAGRGSKLQAWGQGGLAGLQGYGNALNTQAQEQDRALAAKRAAIQEQMLNMQLGQAQRAQAGQQATQDYLTRALTPLGGIDANAASGIAGPRPEALQGIGKTPGFNVGDALKAGVPVDAIPQVQQMLQKQQPKLETISEGQKIGYFGPDGKWNEVAANPKEEDLTRLIIKGPDGRPMINQMVLDAKKQIASAGATSVNTYGSPIPIDIGNGRTGYLQPPTRPGGPTQVLGIPGASSPAMKPLDAGQSNKTEDAKSAVELVGMAEKLLDSGATGSYAGKALDTAAGVFGASTKGAEAAQQLKVIQGMLVSKMPKMSGPQSDKDVIQYQQMAGLVGDETIPVARRKAALKAVRAIQERYAGSPDGKQSGGATVDFGDLK